MVVHQYLLYIYHDLQTVWPKVLPELLPEICCRTQFRRRLTATLNKCDVTIIQQQSLGPIYTPQVRLSRTKMSLKVFAIQIHTLTFSIFSCLLGFKINQFAAFKTHRCLCIKAGLIILLSVLVVWKTTFPTIMIIFSSLAIILHEDVNYLHCQQLTDVLLPHAGRGELFTGDLSILITQMLQHSDLLCHMQ